MSGFLAKRSYLRIMLDFLTGAYNRRDIQNTDKGRTPETNIGKLFSLAADSFDIIHSNAERVRAWDNIDNAKGAVLDRYGLNFGVARQGADDDFYRLLIKVKMLALLSGGDIDTVISAAASLFDVTPDMIELEELFPAKISVGVDEANLNMELYRTSFGITSFGFPSGYINSDLPNFFDVIPLIMQMIKRIVAAGVGIIIKTYTKTETEPLYLAAAGTFATFTVTKLNALDEPPPPLKLSAAALSEINLTITKLNIRR